MPNLWAVASIAASIPESSERFAFTGRPRCLISGTLAKVAKMPSASASARMRAAARGFGAAPPCASIASIQSRSTSAALSSASSRVAPIATHPGQSGMTTPKAPGSPSIRPTYLVINGLRTDSSPSGRLGDCSRNTRRKMPVTRNSNHSDTVRVTKKVVLSATVVGPALGFESSDNVGAGHFGRRQATLLCVLLCAQLANRNAVTIARIENLCSLY